MIPGLAIGKYSRKDCCGAAVKNQAVFRLIHGRQLFPEDIYRWVLSPAVQIAAVFIFKQFFQFIHFPHPEIAGLDDGRSYSVEVVLPLFAQFINYIGKV
jgi:hypothetical protein